MKPGAVIVNCSRGDVIDEQALGTKISSGHFQRAGLDFFIEETPKPEGIVSLPQIWPSPHVA
jgi:D-3-phosphoglycerate dehydrogenase